MVDLVQIVREEALEGRALYKVQHGAPESLIPEMKKPYVLAMVIKHSTEQLPLRWIADLGAVWKPNFKLPGGHELKVVRSDLTVYGSPKPSRSEDSDHFYLAHSIDLGLLLQFANSESWRTHDQVGHSSVHNGHGETFYAVHGSAQIWLTENGKKPVRANLGTGYTKGGTEFAEGSTVAVTKEMWHPVVAFSPAIILIHGPPEMVADQVNGTSFCHKNGLLFRETYKELIQLRNVLRKF